MTQRKMLATVLAVGLCSAVAAREEAVEGPADRPQHVELADDQVPYALRTVIFLRALGDMQQSDMQEGTSRAQGVLARLGLEPDSAAATGLREAAFAFGAAQAPQDPNEHLELEAAALRAAQRGRQLESHRLAGEAVGEWLWNLRADESAIDALMSRLLDSPYLSIAIGTTDPQIDRDFLAAKSQAFEQGLEATLGYVPGLLRQPSREVAP